MVIKFRLSRKGADENNLVKNGSPEIGGFSEDKKSGTGEIGVRLGSYGQNAK